MGNFSKSYIYSILPVGGLATSALFDVFLQISKAKRALVGIACMAPLRSDMST